MSVLCAVTPSARADERADLAAKGEQLAKDGRFGEAIDVFKRADRIQQRASHACLIALAYTRREMWPQAELWLGQCHTRATPGDPLPDWVPIADNQIKERLKAANIVEVTIVVKPAGVPARVTVSSFAPDEVFAPRTIHLPLGTHVIFAKADGYPDGQATVELSSQTPQTVVIDLAAKPVKTDPIGLPAAPREARGTTLLVGGAVAAVAGGVTQIIMGYHRSKLDTDWNGHSAAFDRYRIATISLYSAGAVMLASGYIWRLKSLSAAPLPEGGAVVSIGWER